VKGLEKSAEKLAKSLSVTWNLWTIEPERCIVNGNSSPFSFRVALAQVGDASLELLYPHSGNSVYDEHLMTKGEGFHHTCFAYADLESMQSARDELLGQGHKMIQHGTTEGIFEFCYFELAEANIILELLYLKELPPPEKIIG
jgi:hypothetical protein